MQTQLNWDIFCSVIDNYGDIGVSWRLAKILCHDFQQNVRLFVDDLNALHTLVPETDPLLKQQLIQQIEVQHLNPDLSTRPGDVVIEAFGCELPNDYVEQMKTAKPIWINLEYFSAESWVQDFHGLPSKQANGLDKTFFFPSVLANTGGLMREVDLLQRREQFIKSDHHTPSGIKAWLSEIGLPEPMPNSFKISLFAYENKALSTLFDNWAQSEQPIEVYLPQGRLLSSAQAYFNQPLNAGDTLQQGPMRLHILPFLPQAQYDYLLWLCDLNFVRGEESLVRAQWAGKPFIWHIYPTEDDAHWTKLNAFFDAYSQTLNQAARQALYDFEAGWNHQQIDHQAWCSLMAHWPSLTTHAENWINHLENLGELCSNLVKFVKSKV